MAPSRAYIFRSRRIITKYCSVEANIVRLCAPRETLIFLLFFLMQSLTKQRRFICSSFCLIKNDGPTFPVNGEEDANARLAARRHINGVWVNVFYGRVS